MEFPNLGDHCLVPSCKQLDFLPIRCDACSGIYCKDHYLYTNHSCQKSYLKENQVPVCPLCLQPVPVKRGQIPDIRVSDHIDNECQDDRALNKRSKKGNTIFTNRCNVKGCKQKELIPVLCAECKINFCLKHRHPVDHKCDPRAARIPKSMQQANTSSSSSSTTTLRSAAAAVASTASRRISELLTRQQPVATRAGTSQGSGHGSVEEDEELARAIQASLDAQERQERQAGRPPVIDLTNAATASAGTSASTALQEEEDRQLAQAIAESQNLNLSPRRSSADRCNLS